MLQTVITTGVRENNHLLYWSNFEIYYLKHNSPLSGFFPDRWIHVTGLLIQNAVVLESGCLVELHFILVGLKVFRATPKLKRYFLFSL